MNEWIFQLGQWLLLVLVIVLNIFVIGGPKLALFFDKAARVSPMGGLVAQRSAYHVACG